GLGLVAERGVPRVAESSIEIGLSSALLAIGCAHHAAAFGLRGEASGGGDLAEAAGFPFAASVLVVLGAVLLTLTPWAALAYPVLYWKMAPGAARAWETAEVSVRVTEGA
ncbi:hypothetical protein HY251_01625, partial [bacterium]|nr:hypothetical protein [bacterium]